MKMLKYLAGTVVLLLSVALLVGLVMDNEWRIERQVEVDAPPSKVMAFISLLPNWPEWTVWNSKNYPDMKVSYAGPNWGVGAQQSWQDGGMVGVLEVTDYNPASYMEYNLDMNNGEFAMQCRIETAPLLTRSKVTWSCWGDSGGNPVDKMLMLAYQPMMGKDFQKGLDRLAERFAEKE